MSYYASPIKIKWSGPMAPDDSFFYFGPSFEFAGYNLERNKRVTVYSLIWRIGRLRIIFGELSEKR